MRFGSMTSKPRPRQRELFGGRSRPCLDRFGGACEHPSAGGLCDDRLLLLGRPAGQKCRRPGRHSGRHVRAVVTRFLSYDVKLDTDCAAYCATIMEMPPMREWLDGAKAEPDEVVTSNFDERPHSSA